MRFRCSSWCTLQRSWRVYTPPAGCTATSSPVRTSSFSTASFLDLQAFGMCMRMLARAEPGCCRRACRVNDGADSTIFVFQAILSGCHLGTSGR